VVRGFARFTFDSALSIYFSESGSTGIKGRVVDIGLGGMRALLSEDVAVGQRLWLQFELPDVPGPLRILSKVKHGFDRQYGFQFLNITPEQRDLIRGVCQRLPPL
jgi:c-di-GMP-binding flagellar brake protein YcgR